MTLDRKILDIRLVAMLLIFLVASVALIPTWSPAQAQAGETEEAANNNSPCTSCGQQTANSTNVEVVSVTVLEGEDRNKALATALSSEDYKNMKEMLIERGYTPLINNATAEILKLLVNGTDEVEVLIVSVPFEGEPEFSAGVIFFAFESHTYAIAFVVSLEDETVGWGAFSVDGGKFVKAHCSECPWDCIDDIDCITVCDVGHCCYEGHCWDCEYGCIEMNYACKDACTLVCIKDYAFICAAVSWYGRHAGVWSYIVATLCWVVLVLTCMEACYYQCCLQWAPGYP